MSTNPEPILTTRWLARMPEVTLIVLLVRVMLWNAALIAHAHLS